MASVAIQALALTGGQRINPRHAVVGAFNANGDMARLALTVTSVGLNAALRGGIKKLLLPPEQAEQAKALKASNPVKYQSIEIVSVRSVREAVEALGLRIMLKRPWVQNMSRTVADAKQAVVPPLLRTPDPAVRESGA
jgi:hypothetical protein